jgi:hypothetical protein
MFMRYLFLCAKTQILLIYSHTRPAMKQYFSIVYLCLIFLFVACGNSAKDEAPKADGETIYATNVEGEEELVGYAFTKPDDLYTLPGRLQELSGMQSLSNGLIACIQDEKGIVYLFDREKNEIVREVAWGEDGDYEGVAGDNNALYVLESTGTLYKLSGFLASTPPQVAKQKVALEKGCDAEGLFLLKREGQLLIACKEGTLGDRNVWAYDLQEKKTSPEPYLKMPQQSLEDHFITEGIDRFSLGLKKLLDAKGESGILAPSGIAIHPISGDTYIISAASNLLLVLSPQGVIKQMEELPATLFAHPESITFAENGDLFIGNEGQGMGTAPTILYFKYKKLEKQSLSANP